MTPPTAETDRSASLVLCAEPSVCPAVAADLAQALGLPLVSDPAASQVHCLNLTTERLELREHRYGADECVYVDFLAGQAAYRRRFGGGRNQPLARALGLKGGVNPTVVDATAGLGRDAFVLACLGCTVVLVERSPVVAALLRDGLSRAAQDREIGSMVRERLRLVLNDSRSYLTNLPEDQYPEIVYLDPMYPHRRKSALVKKAMRVLRSVIGDDEDGPDLLATALMAAKQRVVVKRPRAAPPLDGPKPTFQILAPNTRFDIYRTQRQ